MDLSVSPKDEIWFLRVCHHIAKAVYRWTRANRVDHQFLKQILVWEISDFRCGIIEVLALLKCSTACAVSWLRTFRDILSDLFAGLRPTSAVFLECFRIENGTNGCTRNVGNPPPTSTTSEKNEDLRILLGAFVLYPLIIVTNQTEFSLCPAVIQFPHVLVVAWLFFKKLLQTHY